MIHSRPRWRGAKRSAPSPSSTATSRSYSLHCTHWPSRRQVPPRGPLQREVRARNLSRLPRRFRATRTTCSLWANPHHQPRPWIGKGHRAETASHIQSTSPIRRSPKIRKSEKPRIPRHEQPTASLSVRQPRIVDLTTRMSCAAFFGAGVARSKARCNSRDNPLRYPFFLSVRRFYARSRTAEC